MIVIAQSIAFQTSLLVDFIEYVKHFLNPSLLCVYCATIPRKNMWAVEIKKTNCRFNDDLVLFLFLFQDEEFASYSESI